MENLKKHAEEKHGEDWQSKTCYKCMQDFRHNYLLMIHLEEEHSDDDFLFTFKCPDCSFKTILRERLEDHMTRNIHEANDQQEINKKKRKMLLWFVAIAVFLVEKDPF